MQQLAHGKWEIIAQRLALGDTKKVAYEKAGYRTKRPASNCAKLMKVHPEIGERAAFLREQSFRHQTETQLVGRGQIIEGLLENINRAKRARVVKYPPTKKGGKGREVVTQENFSAVNQGYRLLAEIEGHIVRRSEQLPNKDPIADAKANELLQIIERSFNRLGIDFDVAGLTALLGLPGQSQEPSPFGDGPGEGTTEVLPALSEAEEAPRGRIEVALPPLDGSEPGGEVGGGDSGRCDASDRAVPELVEGEEVPEADSRLVRRHH
jgi:hypothetical protein